jgi:hypothetical protein
MTSSPREKLEENLRIMAAIKQQEDCKPGASRAIVK